MKYFDKILIANRGEIALRVMQACREMGISTVAVYSEADKDALFVRTADEAYYIGAAPSSESYLRMDKIIEAVKATGAQAVHPGYGFLAENAAFSQLCQDEGVVFIGPSPEAIVQMGSKINAKVLMQKHGVPTVPGYNGEKQDVESLVAEGKKVGFPLLIKSSAGGGGKGMRIVRNENELKDAVEAAKREALKSFGDDSLLMERYFDSAKHIEFQILGDKHGAVLHFGERECSIQRRYQKIIEEAPSTALSPELRERMGADAVKAAQAIGYDNAGTVEFILDPQGNYYFLEVNTRLQVEHPVTEEVTQYDLVRLQIESAMGMPLEIRQEDIFPLGYAIECRIVAENPDADFAPVTGTVHVWKPLEAEGMRYDVALESGGGIDIYYDSMFAKVISYGDTRAEAVRRMDKALQDLVVLGLTNNIEFLRWALKHPVYAEGKHHTKFIDENLNDFREECRMTEAQMRLCAVAATLYRWNMRRSAQSQFKTIPSGWRNNFNQYQWEKYRFGEQEVLVEYRALANNTFDFKVLGENISVQFHHIKNSELVCNFGPRRLKFHVHIEDETAYIHTAQTGNRSFVILPRFPEVEVENAAAGYAAAMPGEVVKVIIKAGDEVKKGDALLIISSMKMESVIYAHADGVVDEVFVNEKETFPAKKQLLSMK